MPRESESPNTPGAKQYDTLAPLQDTLLERHQRLKGKRYFFSCQSTPPVPESSMAPAADLSTSAKIRLWQMKCSFVPLNKQYKRATSDLGTTMSPGSTHPRAPQGQTSGFTLAEVVFAVAIIAVVFGGLITAYIHTTRRAEWSGYSLAAQALAVQQLEVARSAVWDPSIGKNEFTNLSLLSPNYNAATKTYTGYTTNILDIPISGSNIVFATNYVTVRMFYVNNQSNPPVQIQIVRVDTVWAFKKGTAARLFTNSVSSYFAPDNRDASTL